jgi:hypothetical protein
MESADSLPDTYIGFAQHDKYIWTVEFILDIPPENYNKIMKVCRFKLLHIEDNAGKFYQKIPRYAINAYYYLRKHPLHVFLKRDNLEFHNFYQDNRQKYDTYTGGVTEYYEDGGIFRNYFLVNGKLNGKFTSYYFGGKICEESYFIDDMRHGIATYNERSLYEIRCVFDMNKIVNYEIEILKAKILDLCDDYYNYGNYGNDININNNYYVGTIKIENNQIVSHDIVLTEKKKKEILEYTLESNPHIQKHTHWYT